MAQSLTCHDGVIFVVDLQCSVFYQSSISKYTASAEQRLTNDTPMFTHRLQWAEHVCPSSLALHCVCNNCFCQRLGTARFANQEQRNAQLNTDHHHEHVLLQSLIAGNVRTEVDSIQEHILTPTTNNTSGALRISESGTNTFWISNVIVHSFLSTEC